MELKKYYNEIKLLKNDKVTSVDIGFTKIIANKNKYSNIIIFDCDKAIFSGQPIKNMLSKRKLKVCDDVILCLFNAKNNKNGNRCNKEKVLLVLIEFKCKLKSKKKVVNTINDAIKQMEDTYKHFVRDPYFKIMNNVQIVGELWAVFLPPKIYKNSKGMIQKLLISLITKEPYLRNLNIYNCNDSLKI